MNISQTQLAIFLCLALWLILLTIWQFRLNKFFTRIFFHKGNDLKKTLESILESELHQQKNLSSLSQRISLAEEKSLNYYQKIGLVRFNPFPDTGGTQSFALALLDSKNDGIVIVNLHSREDSSLYAKSVRKGQGTDVPLSKEEQQAIKLANTK